MLDRMTRWQPDQGAGLAAYTSGGDLRPLWGTVPDGRGFPQSRQARRPSRTYLVGSAPWLS